MTKKCSIEGCDRAFSARGMCKLHYGRWFRPGKTPLDAPVTYGTGSIDSNGYRRIASRLEHRIIMERELGRKLERWEHIHHRNGIRNDNTLSNLELLVTYHPPGSRVEDIIEYAVEMLTKYAPHLLEGNNNA